MAGHTEMALKRSSKLYLDDSSFPEMDASYKSRRNSKQEETLPGNTDKPAKSTNNKEPTMSAESTTASSIRSVKRSDAEEFKESRGDRTTAASFSSVSSSGTLFLGIPSSRPADAAVLADGRLSNFGVVVPGIYRGSYPTSNNFDFIRGLSLKTIVTLVQRDEEDAAYTSFMADSGIKHHVVHMNGTKKEQIPIQTMKDILHLVLDQRLHPLLIHCNHGKHRTGCVVAVVRKVSGWDLPAILDEYKSYAAPKIRETDIDYITGFQLASLSSLWVREAKHTIRAGSFFRSTIFTLFVLFVWILSAVGLGRSRRDKDEK